MDRLLVKAGTSYASRPNPSKGGAHVQRVLTDLEGHFPKFLPVSSLRVWMKTKRKAFVIQPLGAGFQRLGLLFPITVASYLMGTERESPAVPFLTRPLRFSGNNAGKSLLMLAAQMDPRAE